ncbi:DUF2469 family protein [Nocardioides immobilis]|uniref:DUF2469 family protein n=1 Tax=Nocardioides immobilis TaxID=2049295 RepID=UPI001FEA64A9|nr:DUF2469 family protein [Nocardioides immobilis]
MTVARPNLGPRPSVPAGTSARPPTHLARTGRPRVPPQQYVTGAIARFYRCNSVDVRARTEAGEDFFEVTISDGWVGGMHRPARFANNVKALTSRTSTSRRSPLRTSGRR